MNLKIQIMFNYGLKVHKHGLANSMFMNFQAIIKHFSF